MSPAVGEADGLIHPLTKTPECAHAPSECKQGRLEVVFMGANRRL